MNIKGTVKAVLNVESGTSKQGNAWQKGGFVITTDGNFPKDVAFTLFGEGKVALCPKVGESVEVHFDVASREYNGRWYSDITAYRIDRPNAQPKQAPQESVPQPTPVQTQPQASDNGDLPF